MWDRLYDNFDLWIILGLAAQFTFTARFVVQWIASERRGRSVIPIAFWYLSLAGSSGLLVYAIARGDPVFILGQSAGSFVYLRNLTFVYRERRAAQTKPGPS